MYVWAGPHLCDAIPDPTYPTTHMQKYTTIANKVIKYDLKTKIHKVIRSLYTAKNEV